MNEDLIDLQDSMVLLNEHANPQLNSLIYDILFRPTELENVAMWDQFVQYNKVRIQKGKTTQDDDDMDVDNEDDPVSDNFRFSAGHPQIGTHVLQKRKIHHIPVLSGTPIPRSDLPDQKKSTPLSCLLCFVLGTDPPLPL
ncbi:hypothetical protein C8R47DRAFT_1074207 [Mycena vitilis]|nr:hypothetical protein C8R47DRAFT_1074207 [Mycena vitilis]